MKTKLLPTVVANSAKRIPMGFGLAMAMLFAGHNATAIPIVLTLGTASHFGVLAGSGITITGPTGITGDIGSSPTPAITGLENLNLNGVNQSGNAVTAQAQNDLTTAYNAAAGFAAGAYYTDGADLGGQTLIGGVYNGSSSLFLTGTLTLDGQGNPDSVFIIQVGSTLITAANSSVVLIGCAQACHVYWQIGSSATLGTGTAFMGNLLALTSITLNTGASLDGRALAENGAVTLDNNNIIVPVCNSVASTPDGGSTLLLLGGALASLLAFGRRFVFPAC